MPPSIRTRARHLPHLRGHRRRGPFSEPTPATVTTPPAKKGDKSKSKDPSKPLAEVTADGQTNRRDQSSEEEAIVPYYNNFFTTYRLGPEDVISVTVFGQDRYSKSGIKIPPSGRISLALIPDGIFVNGKTVDQVAELIKKRYDEYIIDPQVSVSLDQAGSYRYSVIGDVAQPGIKLMSRRLSVTEALSEAGGVLQTGNRSKVFVLRRQANGVLTPIPVNVLGDLSRAGARLGLSGARRSGRRARQHSEETADDHGLHSGAELCAFVHGWILKGH